MTKNENLTPMLKQYMEIKQAHLDCLVMFRLGDFYELFFDDAKTAAYELDLVLTARSAGQNQKAPMCGVPYHAASSYIQRLVDKGYKVAIVEQTEDPKQAVGIVRREVVKIVTPGTMVDELLEDKDHHYLASLEIFANQAVLALCELVSGKTVLTRFPYQPNQLKSSLMQYQIKELVCSETLAVRLSEELDTSGLQLSVEKDAALKDQFIALFKTEEEIVQRAFGRLLNYAISTQKRSFDHIQALSQETATVKMDYASILNLELIEPLRQQAKHDTLFDFLDHCQTSMGSRLLKQWMMKPLADLSAIEVRQRQSRYFMNHYQDHAHLIEHLKQCYDMERLVGKIALKSASASDVHRLRVTLNQLPELISALNDSVFDSLKNLNQCETIRQDLNNALQEEISYKHDGPIFKQGVHPDLDEYRSIERDGRKWLLAFEQKERERTDIKNLKVGYNRVFGYYIEVSKGNIPLVKDEYGYIRKQTLSNQERFITEELKEMEDKLLHASERATQLERALFEELLEKLNGYLSAFQKIAGFIASLDVLQAFAAVSKLEHYVLPEMHDGFDCEIIEGRHPLLEKQGDYVANHCRFEKAQSIHLLTGPNMGGKSTYMRQIALSFILAHIGMHVPAKKARIPLIDALFTRMGASDDILEGQSTFMIEMIEANYALQNATERSLIFFDEIGRGTSTFDGMALAQSMLEYVTKHIQCKMIFSTHYHELTRMEEDFPLILNEHVEVSETDGHVTFLYKVKKGKANRSYGINVARLAHLPDEVLYRAHQLLKELESNKRVIQQGMDIIPMETISPKLKQIERELKALEINETTPLEALAYLNAWKGLKD